VYGFAEDVTNLKKAMDISDQYDTTKVNEVRAKGAPTPANCKVTYTPATATAFPTYVTDDTGC
jgi:MSHA pilin protein MshA